MVYDWPAPAPPADDDDDDDDGDDYLPPRQRRRRRRRSGFRRGRASDGSGLVNAVAIIYAIVGVLNIGCAALVMFVGVAAGRSMDSLGDLALVRGLVGVIAFVIVLLAIPDLLAAYGIWHRRYWGYVLGLVLAGINGLWAIASILWGDVCSLFVCGSCSIFTFVVLCQSRYADEFS